MFFGVIQQDGFGLLPHPSPPPVGEGVKCGHEIGCHGRAGILGALHAGVVGDRCTNLAADKLIVQCAERFEAGVGNPLVELVGAQFGQQVIWMRVA